MIFSKKKKIKKDYIYLAVILLLIILNLFCFIRLTSPKSFINKYKNNYPFIDFSRSFIPQEFYLSNLQPLRNSLNELVSQEQSQGNQVSIYFEYLNTGGNISINQDLRLIPASLNKLPVAMVVLDKVEKGEWLLTDRLVLLAEDVDANFGFLYNEPINSSFTIEFLLQEMLQRSDNTAFNILLRNVTVDGVIKILDEVGLQELFDERGNITAKEYSRLFRSLYTANLLNREYSQLLLSWLTQTDFNEFISYDIPTDIPIAHKFGLNKDYLVFADSGIIYLPNRPYLLTILVHPENFDSDPEQALQEAGSIMQEIANIIYSFINDQSNY